MANLFNNIEQLIIVNPPLAFLAVFLAGVFVSFTPCVYPVIPLTLGYIGARSAGNRFKGFTLSVVYVTGMALTYAALGAFASLSGKVFGLIGSHPATYFVVANVCLVLGLSMLGVFNLPQISFIGKKDVHIRSKGYFGAFAVGVVSGLIVGPCTAPVLAGILVFVGSRQNLLYGFSLLFTFGFGIGFLMIILGTFTGLLASIPKSGGWLDKIKKAFGWIMIFSAEYLFIKMGGLL